MNTEQQGFTVEEAARLLGVSVQTVRRRVMSGELRAVKEKGITGQRWKIFIDQAIEGELVTEDSEHAQSNVEDNTAESDKLNLSAALAIIDHQRATIEQQQGTIEELLRERAEMAGQLGGFAARLEALTVKQIEGPKGRSWWQRLRRR